MLVAATHFIIVKERDQEIEKMLKQASNEWVKLMFKLLHKYNRNLPVILLFPEYVYSVDDTSVVLVGSNTMRKSVSRSRYTQKVTNQMCGLRVKLPYKFSAAGMSDPIFM